MAIEISTWTQFNAIRTNLTGDYILVRDLLVADGDYPATFSNLGTVLGTIDGNGHKIYGLNLTTSNYNSGLLSVGTTGTVKNLSIVGGSLSPGFNFQVNSLLCCYLNGNGKIQNCHVNGTITGNSGVTGLVCALLYQPGLIEFCSSSGSISAGGTGDIGGIVGRISAGSGMAIVRKCKNTANVSGGFEVGGAIGKNEVWCLIEDCYSSGSVSATSSARGGGFIGGNYSGGTVRRCYSSGTTNANVRGFSGDTSGATFADNYYDKTVSGKTDTVGATPKTTAEMKTQSTFTGWDFSTIWSIDEGVSYPELIAFMAVAPNSSGNTQAEFEIELTAAGLILGTVTTAYSETVAIDDIISQSPAAGTAVAVGSAVDIVVSLGPEETAAPDLTGLNGAQAKAAIIAAGFMVGTVSVVLNTAAVDGSVISQSPAAGTMLMPGDTISFTVAVNFRRITVIGYDNILGKDGVRVTASSTQAGYYVENLWDNATYDGWKSEAEGS